MSLRRKTGIFTAFLRRKNNIYTAFLRNMAFAYIIIRLYLCNGNKLSYILCKRNSGKIYDKSESMLPMKTAIHENEILALEDGKTVGKIEFALQDNTLSILHTYAYESGKGIGSILMQAALSFAEEHHYTILPVCSFAQEYMRKKGLMQ